MNIKRHSYCPCTQEDTGRRKQIDLAKCNVSMFFNSFLFVAFDLVFIVAVGDSEGAGWTLVSRIFSPFFIQCWFNKHKFSFLLSPARFILQPGDRTNNLMVTHVSFRPPLPTVILIRWLLRRGRVLLDSVPATNLIQTRVEMFRSWVLLFETNVWFLSYFITT